MIEKVGTGGLVVDEHPATEQFGATIDYRYTGKDPDNYIKFNNEVWRIIGVFDVDDGSIREGQGNLEKRMKIVRDPIGSMAWNSDGTNIWSGSVTMSTLNGGDYFNRKGTYQTTGLTTEAKAFIADAKWYLGGAVHTGSITTKQFYNYERGSLVYSKPINWVGKVGLIYPSDYGYATSGGSEMTRKSCVANSLSYWSNKSSSSYSDCVNNDWLHYSGTMLTISHITSSSEFVFSISSLGAVLNSTVKSSNYVRPVVYLKADVKIVSGEGTVSSPYEISLE